MATRTQRPRIELGYTETTATDGNTSSEVICWRCKQPITQWGSEDRGGYYHLGGCPNAPAQIPTRAEEDITPSKYQAALSIKNAIETTEKHTLYCAHSKTTGEFWDHLFEARRIKRAYRNAQ